MQSLTHGSKAYRPDENTGIVRALDKYKFDAAFGGAVAEESHVPKTYLLLP